MKRIFTSLALLCATLFTLHAQDCVFQYEGKPLEDGATVTINAVEDPLWNTMICDTNPSDSGDNGLFLKNNTNKELSCSAKITIQSNTMSGTNIQWCMGIDCMPITSTTKSKDFKLAASSKIMTKFDCEPSKEGEMMTKLEVTTGGKTYTVFIHFIYDNNHVADSYVSAAKPVAYYTLDGRQVSQRPRGVCLVKFSDGRVRKMVSK